MPDSGDGSDLPASMDRNSQTSQDDVLRELHISGGASSADYAKSSPRRALRGKSAMSRPAALRPSARPGTVARGDGQNDARKSDQAFAVIASRMTAKDSAPTSSERDVIGDSRNSAVDLACGRKFSSISIVACFGRGILGDRLLLSSQSSTAASSRPGSCCPAGPVDGLRAAGGSTSSTCAGRRTCVARPLELHGPRSA